MGIRRAWQRRVHACALTGPPEEQGVGPKMSVVASTAQDWSPRQAADTTAALLAEVHVGVVE